LLAVAIALYSIVSLIGMARYGVSTWLDRGEGFTVYTSLLAKMSIWQRREDGRMGMRLPVVGALHVTPTPGLVAVITLLIGSVSFDGLSRTGWWANRVALTVQRLADSGVPGQEARIVFNTLAFAALLAIAWGAFELAAMAAHRLGSYRPSVARTAQLFAPTLLPIAVAYVVAHYFSFFFFQAQDIVRLASDPLGRGWDVFGTADFAIDYSVLSANTVWLVQVGAIVVGHVLGLVLAHERAVQLAPTKRAAVTSQLAMLALMVLYTVGGLYFLSEGLT
jgi:hypothetical protein